MTKSKLIKELINRTNGSKVLFKEYDVKFNHNETEYFVKILNAKKNTLVTVNSKIMWELKKGKPDGPRFKTTSKELIDLFAFTKHKNRIILFLEKPYKVLKALNESDLADISSDNYVHKTHYFSEINELFNTIF